MKLELKELPSTSSITFDKKLLFKLIDAHLKEASSESKLICDRYNLKIEEIEKAWIDKVIDEYGKDVKIEWTDDFCLIKGVKYFENAIIDRDLYSSLERAWNIRLKLLAKNHISWVNAILLAFGSRAIITWPKYYTCFINFNAKFDY